MIALKVLADRHQDLTDLGYLITAATEADLDEARASVATIQERGFNRGQNLPEDLAAIISPAQKLPTAGATQVTPWRVSALDDASVWGMAGSMCCR